MSRRTTTALRPQYQKTNQAFQILEKQLASKIKRNPRFKPGHDRIDSKSETIYVLCPGAGNRTNVNIIERTVCSNFEGRNKNIIILCLEINPNFVDQAKQLYRDYHSSTVKVLFEEISIANLEQIKEAMAQHEIPGFHMIYLAHPVLSISDNERTSRIVPNLLLSFFKPTRYHSICDFEHFIVAHLPGLLISESRGLVVAITTNPQEMSRLDNLLCAISHDSKTEKLSRGTQTDLEPSFSDKEIKSLELPLQSLQYIQAYYYRHTRAFRLPQALKSSAERQDFLAKHTLVNMVPTVSSATSGIQIALFVAIVGIVIHQLIDILQPSISPGFRP